MDWLYFTRYSIHGLTQFLLALLITLYLVRVPDKPQPMRLLVIFFAGFLITSLANFLLVSVYVPWRSVFGFSEAVGGAISLVALIQFAYAFPENRHKKEARVAFWVSIGLCLTHALLVDRRYIVSSNAFFYSALVMTVQVSWPVVVMVRKVLLFADDAQTRSWWAKLRNPGNRHARALRAFALLSCLWVVLSGAVMMESLRVLSLQTLLVTLSGVYLFFLFGFVLVFLNNAPSSLKVKFVGLMVVLVLLVMGDMGAFMVRDFELRYHQTCLAEIQQTRKALLAGDSEGIPQDVLQVNRYDLVHGGTHDVMFARGEFDNRPFHDLYVVRVFTPNVIAALRADPQADPNVIRDGLIEGFNRADMVALQLGYGFAGLLGGVNYSIYYFTVEDQLFEVHYPVLRYMGVMHGFAEKLIGFVLVTTVFIVIFFPLFIKSGIDRPLQALLGGVREVNAGRLDVSVPVYVEDEIGYVARSFNNMVGSVRAADEQLKQYAQELEQRVVERTQDLQEKNAVLEQTLADLKAAQQRLILQEKMASLGELVAGVAHEINNPIGAVKSSADVSVRCVAKIEAEVDEQENLASLKNSRGFVQSLQLLKDNAQVMQIAGERVATLVTSLKNFSRVDEAEFQQTDIHEGLESSLTLVRVSEKVSVVKTYGEVADVFCAPGQINQVFYNVLKNAAQAVGDGGEIHIRTFEAQGYVCVLVRDTGPGISKDILDQIFEFRFTQTDTRVKMGSGLASAYDIVQKHKGEISITSEEGAGTEVMIRLPIT